MWAGSRYQSYLRDTAGVGEWGGINILVNDTSADNLATYIDLLDTCQIITVTGVVTEYLNKFTEIILLPKYPIEFVGQVAKRDDPIEVNISDFANGSAPNLLGEKYEGVYVVIKNVISTNRNTGAVANPFSITDQYGNTMIVHGQSCYFTKRTYKARDWDPPIDGTAIQYIRGVIGQNSDGSFVIRPVYPEDLVTGATPPVVSNIKRDKTLVNSNQAVTITNKVVDLDGYVKDVKLYYRVNGGNVNVLQMTKTADTTVYTATIPGVAKDSALVDYYIWAKDNDDKVTAYPLDTVKSKYFYLVLNRPITIQDCQYSPFGGGYSAYNNYRVTISGVVTADTSDVQGDGNTVGARVHMQNGSGPWSGIWIFGVDVVKLKRGDNVTLSGLIDESNGTTRLDSITSVTVNSSNNSLPDPVLISTRIANLTNGDVNAEQWESVLVKYKDVKVVSENADGNPGPLVTGNNNYGEILIADTSNVGSRLELQEGNHPYHNTWDTLVTKVPGNIKLKVGDKFSEVRGVFFYEFSEYKLIPRKTDDFVGYNPLDVKEENLGAVKSYSLLQNYPNPFNPSTTIRFSVPNSGVVSLKVYDVLGREVRTLLNEEKHAGSYSVSFDLRNLSSGIYFYRLQSGSFVDTKKMILMK
jgi:Predicted extracellular nuclease